MQTPLQPFSEPVADGRVVHVAEQHNPIRRRIQRHFEETQLFFFFFLSDAARFYCQTQLNIAEFCKMEALKKPLGPGDFHQPLLILPNCISTPLVKTYS